LLHHIYIRRCQSTDLEVEHENAPPSNSSVRVAVSTTTVKFYEATLLTSTTRRRKKPNALNDGSSSETKFFVAGRHTSSSNMNKRSTMHVRLYEHKRMQL